MDVADERREQNARFIANARRDIPRLVAEIRRLRRLLDTDSIESNTGAGPL